jgi:hypothetical protein
MHGLKQIEVVTNQGGGWFLVALDERGNLYYGQPLTARKGPGWRIEWSEMEQQDPR